MEIEALKEEIRNLSQEDLNEVYSVTKELYDDYGDGDLVVDFEDEELEEKEEEKELGEN